MLNSEQKQLVVENMGLVSYVIKKYIAINDQRWEYDLEDLHQVGYEGLCIAAMAYQSDKGATYWHFAEIVVRNHLYNYCRQINRQQIDIKLEAAEQVSDEGDMEALILQMVLSSLDMSEYNMAVYKGIEALKLKNMGYSGKEIRAYYQVPANHVSAWIAKARKILRQELLAS